MTINEAANARGMIQDVFGMTFCSPDSFSMSRRTPRSNGYSGTTTSGMPIP
jgi:hypothetical protein